MDLCHKTYEVPYSVQAGDSVELPAISEECNTSPTRGFKYLYKVPKPRETKFCIETPSQHMHGKIKTSSDLVADDSGGVFEYFVKGNPSISRKLAKRLQVQEGDQVAFRSVEMPIAEEIVLESPSEEGTGKPQVPKLVSVGMFFMNRSQDKHPVYGGVFSNEHAF